MPHSYLISFSHSTFIPDTFLSCRSLNIHVSNASTLYDSWKPVLLGGTPGKNVGNYFSDYRGALSNNNCIGSGLSLGSKFNDTITQLIITFKSFNGTHANISFCQYAVTSETGAMCSDGIDNDCNGL